MGVTPAHEEGFVGWAQVEGSDELLQTSTEEWSLSFQTKRPTVKGLVSLDVRNHHPLTYPIHLPSHRRVETPTIHSDHPTLAFLVPTLMTLVSTTVVQMHGDLQSWLLMSY